MRFDKGFAEAGYVEGQNWRSNTAGPKVTTTVAALAADLVDRQVAVILAMGGTDPARAAKAATSTIPIVFVSAADPVRTGLVASLNRPGGNVTGVSLIASALDEKRLGLLHELVPKASHRRRPDQPELSRRQGADRRSAGECAAISA